jgi:hypothetical protein
MEEELVLEEELVMEEEEETTVNEAKREGWGPNWELDPLPYPRNL